MFLKSATLTTLLFICFFPSMAQLNSRQIDSVYNKSVEYSVQKKYKLAIEGFTKVIDASWNNVNAYASRAFCFYNMRNRPQACSDWKVAAFLDDPEAILMLRRYCNEAARPVMDEEDELTRLKNPLEMDGSTETAQFPGGRDGLIDYLSKNLKHPDANPYRGVSEIVYVSFVVDRSGNVAAAKILRGFDEDCNKEAIRVVMAMPQWKPAMNPQGQPVACELTLPLKFSGD